MAIVRKNVETNWSDVVVHNNVAYVAGQVGTSGAPVAEQTREILALIDRLLADVGSDKSKLLHTTIWLADIRDADDVNEVWGAWVPKGCAPARACGGVQLHDSGTKIEIIVTAAV